MSNPFCFKQFQVYHDKTAHKIGTDAVLLGAWIDISFKPNQILDVGTGCGIIALMMAQRSLAEQIDAIEIQAEAFQECVENFENSPWNDRLFCYHGDVQDLVQEPDLKYDLILSNPPFFEEQQPKFDFRQQAREQHTLNYIKLINSVVKLIHSKGHFAVILPYEKHQDFISLAKDKGLYLNKITQVKGRAKANFKRSLMQFSYAQSSIDKDELILEITRHQYTEAYKSLIQDFYLNL